MLQKLHERLQGIFAWVIVGLVAITFAFFGVDYLFQRSSSTNVIVEVNNQPITDQTFEASYRRTRQFRDPTSMSPVREKLLKKEVLDALILNSVTSQAANKYGFDVNIDQANAAIISIPQFQEEGHFSTDRYQQAITGAFFTPETFQNEVRKGMLLNQQRFTIIGTEFALPDEVKQFVNLYMQTRNYKYFIVPVARFLHEVTVSDQEVANYYTAHPQSFISPEMVSIDYIKLSMQDIKNKITISDADIKRYKEENADQETALDSAEVMRAQILADKAQTEYGSMLDKLADLSFQTPDSLTPAADELGLKIHTTQPFTTLGGAEELTKNKQIINAAFSNDVLNLGNNSEMMQFGDDSVVVLRLHRHVTAKPQTLAEVSAQIKQQLLAVKAKAAAEQQGKKYQQAKPSDLQWITVEKAKRDGAGSKVPESINEHAFALAKVGDIVGFSQPTGDYVLVQLENIAPGDLAELDEERITSITQQLEASYGVMDYDLYVNDLMKQAHIVNKKS